MVRTAGRLKARKTWPMHAPPRPPPPPPPTSVYLATDTSHFRHATLPLNCSATTSIPLYDQRSRA